MSGSSLQDDHIVIREAKPDYEEGLVFANFFNDASEGFFRIILGKKTYEIIADAFIKPNNPYSYENAVIIEYKGKIVGMASGYTSTEKEGFNKNVLGQFKNGSKPRIMLFSATGRFLSLFLGPRGKADYYLQAIAVSSQMRGKGLGQELLKHSEEIAARKGCETISLDVSGKNETAVKSYLKFGMTVSASWPGLFNLPPLFKRMVKKL